MRGKAFHNFIAKQTQTIFCDHGWQVYAEYRYRCNGVTTYFDLFAIKEDHKIACEIETTVRHALDNITKAVEAGICLWVIVATRGMRGQIERKLLNIKNHQPIRVLMFCQLEAELINFPQKQFLKGTKS